MLARSHRRNPEPSSAEPATPQWMPQNAGRGNQALLAQLKDQEQEQEQDADFEHFMAIERAEKSNGWHMSFLDRGLANSLLEDQVQDIPDRLAAPQSGTSEAPRMPVRGELPNEVADLPWLHEDIRNASIASAEWDKDGELRTRWYGREDQRDDQYWSATKQMQALGLVSLLNKQHPDLDIDDVMIREADQPDTAVPVHSLMKDVVSYEGGTNRSNAGARTLGGFQTTDERDAQLQSWTGHDGTFMGGYGAAPLFEQPELVTTDGQIVATAPETEGTPGPNLVSAYDLTRTLAMASWHEHLGEDQQIPDAQWHSLESVLRAMGYDSARYIDAAIERLGVADRLQNVVVASKLGHGIRSATGLAETVYTGVLQFDDAQTGSHRSLVFTLRGEKADSVELDARISSALET